MKNLFSSHSAGPFELSHRVVMAPMTRNRANKQNAPHRLNATYYQQRSDAALIITEATQICPEGMGYPGTPGIHSAAQIDGWREVTDMVHEAGGRIILQLWHVGRISHPELQPDGKDPVAPSPIKPAGEAMTTTGMKPFVTPRELAFEELSELVDLYRTAAKNADSAGFDGVEVHGANGYLLDQFTRSSTNVRDDVYGGSVENRCRFPLEVTDAVVDVWGADRVGYRISPFQPYNDISDADPAVTFSYLATELAKRDLLYLHVVELGGNQEDGEFLQGRNPLFNRIRETWRNTLITNGGYDRTKADAVIEAGQADLVAFGTPFLANPDLPERLHRGFSYNEPNRPTFYGGGAEGYTDYPFYSD